MLHGNGPKTGCYSYYINRAMYIKDNYMLISKSDIAIKSSIASAIQQQLEDILVESAFGKKQDKPSDKQLYYIRQAHQHASGLSSYLSSLKSLLQ